MAVSYSAEVLLDTPRAYWRMDETSGTTAVDSISARNGTHSGTATVNQVSALADATGKSVLYGGGKTAIPAAAIAAGNTITVEFWAKKTNANTANSAFEVATAGNFRMINIHLQWNDGNIYWDCGTGVSSGDYDRIYKACDFDVLQWHHYAFVKDAVAGTMYIYVDGLQWHSGTGLVKAVGTPGAASIGGYAVTGVTDVPIAAYVDEFAVYSTALSAARIARHYQEGRTTYVGQTATVTYTYGQSSMGFLTPTGVATLTIIARGATGGDGGGSRGGYGLAVTCTRAATANETLTIRVGGKGLPQAASVTNLGGWPGGGNGGIGGGNVNGASGGGYTQVSSGGSIVIAGAGGGGGSHAWNGGEGGQGGDAAWQNGGTGVRGLNTFNSDMNYVGFPGTGGTTSAGGTGGAGAANGTPNTAPYRGYDGASAQGGTGGNNYSSYGGCGGGGGGGNYGGGGGGGGHTYGGGSGAGAGSSYVGNGGTYVSSAASPGNSDGQVLIQFAVPATMPYVPAVML